MAESCLSIKNMSGFSLSEIPIFPVEEFQGILLKKRDDGFRLVALFALKETRPFSICAVIAEDKNGFLEVLAGNVEGGEYDSITPHYPEAHLFEREMAENGGPIPLGHPWLKPVRFPSRGGAVPVGLMDFYRVEGEEVHEVAVGPVHAGVIEPGHFRFQCHGEIVLHLEISLGYQHRGVEASFAALSPMRRILMAESISGDSTAGHAGAYCGAIEGLSNCAVPPRAEYIRCIAQELERLACHIGDLGAMAGDVGFLPTSSFCGRIRGDVLNLTASICGNRFSRGFFRPGGTAWDLDDLMIGDLLKKAERVRNDSADAIGLLWETPTVMSRFENTGIISFDDGASIGLVGPAARACGLSRDVRNSFPYWAYVYRPIPVVVEERGDVLSRAKVRWGEIQRSFEYVEKNLQAIPDSEISSMTGPLNPSSMVVSMTEGWRGEIVHIALTDEKGDLSRYKIVDPSFHNWFGLSLAMRNRGISDFPLCNKSFNLSYCGFDL